jgi:hypothetical protein
MLILSKNSVLSFGKEAEKEIKLLNLKFMDPCIVIIFYIGTVLSVLWVAYATHSTLKPVPTLPR